VRAPVGRAAQLAQRSNVEVGRVVAAYGAESTLAHQPRDAAALVERLGRADLRPCAPVGDETGHLGVRDVAQRVMGRALTRSAAITSLSSSHPQQAQLRCALLANP
jgi:hypothetical protein